MSASYLPSNLRLLHGARNRIAEIVAKHEDAETRWALQAVDVVLNEMMLREDRHFFAGYCRRLQAHIDAGLRLTAARGIDLDTQALTIDDTLAFDELTSRIGRGHEMAVALVEAFRSVDDSAARAWIEAMTALECELHARRATQAQRPAPDLAVRRSPPTREEFQGYLRKKFPAQPDLTITDYRVLVGGFQKYTILFDTEDRTGGHQSCVIRADRNERFVFLDAGTVVAEFDVVKLAYAAGVPVAEPLWLEPDASMLGRPFFVSRRVAGANYGSAMAMDTPLTDKVLRSFVDMLAKVHRIPIDDGVRRSALGHWLDHRTLADNTRAAVAEFAAQPYVKAAAASPAMSRLFAWLADNVPSDDAAPVVLHVDCGPHNILVDNEQVTALLDWESSRIGDPAEDISNFIGMMRANIDPAKTLAWYRESTGFDISEYRLRYFDVYTLMKTFVACAATASMYENEADASTEWCYLALPYSHSVVSVIEQKIAAAEAVRKR